MVVTPAKPPREREDNGGGDSVGVLKDDPVSELKQKKYLQKTTKVFLVNKNSK